MTRALTGLRRTPALLLLAALLGAVLALGGQGTASAHAVLLDTLPQDGAVLVEAPEVAELQFNEPVRPVEGAVALYGGSGADGTDGDAGAGVGLDARAVDQQVLVELPPGLGDGDYTLSWRVVSADGHPISGVVQFRVGEGSAPDSAGTAVATGDSDTVGGPADAAAEGASTTDLFRTLTGLHYVGLLVFAGLVFFQLVVRRVPGADPTAGPDGLTRIGLLTGLVVASAAGVLLPVVQAWNTVGVGPVAALGLGSGPGPGSWLSAVAWDQVAVGAASVLLGVEACRLALASGGEGAAEPVAARGDEPCTRVSVRADAALPTVAVGLVAVMLAVPVLTGHTQTMQPRWVMIGADLVHLFAAAFWVGGVLGLVGLLRTVSTVGSLEVARVVARFSSWAVWSVVAVAGSGLVMALLVLSRPDDLVTTGYGHVLLLKLAALVPVLAMAAWNRYRLVPLVAAGCDDPPIVAAPRPPVSDAPAAGHRRLGRVMRWEFGVLLVVVAVTGVLTTLDPSAPANVGAAKEQVDAGPISLRGQGQGLAVDGTLASADSGGRYEFELSLEHEGAPVQDGPVQVSARHAGQSIGPLTTDAVLEPATGRYIGSLVLPVSGEWELRVSARVDTFSQPIVALPVHLP